MKTKAILALAVLLLSVFLIGCGERASYDGYSTYQQGQQNQYVGGGCGVAPSAEYADVAGAFNAGNSAA